LIGLLFLFLTFALIAFGYVIMYVASILAYLAGKNWIISLLANLQENK